MYAGLNQPNSISRFWVQNLISTKGFPVHPLYLYLGPVQDFLSEPPVLLCWRELNAWNVGERRTSCSSRMGSSLTTRQGCERDFRKNFPFSLLQGIAFLVLCSSVPFCDVKPSRFVNGFELSHLGCFAKKAPKSSCPSTKPGVRRHLKACD